MVDVLYASYLLFEIKNGKKKALNAAEFRADLEARGMNVSEDEVTGRSLKKDAEVALFEALAKMAVVRDKPLNTEPKAFVRNVKSLWSNLQSHFEGRSPCECVACRP